MKLAQFKTATDWITYYDERQGALMVKEHGYTQLSEFVEVEFPPLPIDVVVSGQLKQLDVMEAELRSKFQEKLNELANERAKLLSLTHETL